MWFFGFRRGQNFGYPEKMAIWRTVANGRRQRGSPAIPLTPRIFDEAPDPPSLKRHLVKHRQGLLSLPSCLAR